MKESGFRSQDSGVRNREDRCPTESNPVGPSSPLQLDTSSPLHPIIPASRRAQEGGWALFGLILALTVLGMVLVSSVTPNYKLSVQREKEAEMLYRGDQMAQGIARWYNNGFLTGPPQLTAPPAYGYLKELSKLKEGVRLGVREIKFVRPSATIDPMSSEEWEPVYARDPRILPFLQAWAAETGGILTPQLLAIAGPPSKAIRVNPTTPTVGTPAPGTSTPGTPAPPGGQAGGTATGTAGQGAVANRPTGQNRTNSDPDDDDDDDDDDEEDPLAHIFQGSTFSNLPIVAVAPKAKGPSVKTLYGLKNYEEWIFLYIPLRPVGAPPPQQQNPQQQRPRIGQ